VIEVKSVVPDIQAMLTAIDRKGRLARDIARERGWQVTSVTRLLVRPDDRTARRRAGRHATTFRPRSRHARSRSAGGSGAPRGRCTACCSCQMITSRALVTESPAVEASESWSRAWLANADRRGPDSCSRGHANVRKPLTNDRETSNCQK
jgi:hypothetical protein